MKKKREMAEGNLSRTQAQGWDFLPLLAQLYLSFGSWVPLTPLSNNSSLGRQNSAKVAQPHTQGWAFQRQHPKMLRDKDVSETTFHQLQSSPWATEP